MLRDEGYAGDDDEDDAYYDEVEGKWRWSKFYFEFKLDYYEAISFEIYT